jgi:hypothetical protein
MLPRDEIFSKLLMNDFSRGGRRAAAEEEPA